jgi:hypothetical protein
MRISALLLRMFLPQSREPSCAYLMEVPMEPGADIALGWRAAGQEHS